MKAPLYYSSLKVITSWCCSILVFFLVTKLGYTQTPDTINVTFDVSVPTNTPSNSVIYIVGTFNSWDPGPSDSNENDIPMTNIGNNTHQVTLPFAPGESIEYKYTRGSWQTIEKGAANEEISNRTLIIPDSDHILHDTVVKWSDIDITVSQYPVDNIPNKYSLSQNYPNPFNPVTTIQFATPRTGHISLMIMDMLGREVKTLVDDYLPAGEYYIKWDATDFPSGVYFYRIRARNFNQTMKLLLLQ